MTTEPTPPPHAALRSVYTSNLPNLFQQLGISLIVSTYQAGKLIVIRADHEADNQPTINTHFSAYKKPMGLAVTPQRLAVGSERAIHILRNIPEVARQLEPVGKYDACYIPLQNQVSGNIDIHEMAWGKAAEQFRQKIGRKSAKPLHSLADAPFQWPQLWFINTRFSCLCTHDPYHSFIPHWRPPFITAYSPEDRCHLNGLGMVDGLPRYVTMLGETDTVGGWRANKANGGLLMDVTTNKILLRGLSMPHSPRWYQNQLWFLESGEGGLAVVEQDLTAKHKPTELTYRHITQLPGFTRGLDFHGNLAFIGLSQVRESATFSGLPLTERLTERVCGVWVVHVLTGETLGFVRFEEAVQEIFAVQVMPHARFPEILEWQHDRVTNSYILPDEALKEVAPPRVKPS